MLARYHSFVPSNSGCHLFANGGEKTTFLHPPVCDLSSQMEHSTNRVAPEASTDERASAPSTSPFAGYEAVALRHRADGWTPARQVEFLEALADTGIVRKAAASVGMSEQSVTRLRRRAEARTFDLACEA